jgi:hypothetical protein
MTTVRLELPGHGPITIDDEQWRDAADAGSAAPPRDRLAYAAAHVILRDDYATREDAPDRPGPPEALAAHVDWEATIAFRRHLAGLGLGIAEAMDTAQRFELGWPAAERLIRETGRLAPPAGFVAGAGTDHLERVRGPDDLVAGLVHQARVIAAAGGIPVVLPRPWLSERRRDADAYLEVYAAIIAALEGPLFIHWLGPMFLPSLEGYFPGDSFERVMAIDPGKVRGAKLSLLDADREIALRRRLLEHDQVMLTGDDLHFASLIEGADPTVLRRTRVGDRDVALGDFSHALLGILDGIAAPAATALRCLDAGRTEDFRRIMDPAEALSRIVFEPPTSAYKVGLAFIAWLNGHQTNPMLVNHLERERNRDHLTRLVAATAGAGALTDARCAAERLRAWCGAI